MVSRKRLGIKRYINIFLIVLCIFLVVGAILVYVVGNDRIKNSTKKNITNATEVLLYTHRDDC